MHKFEIEIKSLLGSKEKANDLINKMRRQDPNLKTLGSHKQLNHYFIGGDLNPLYDKIKNLLDDASKNRLADLSRRAKDFSVRTREADGKVILVIKATVDDTTSENGIARLEWERSMDLQLDKLDELVLTAGFSCQAKWSRERQEFSLSSHQLAPYRSLRLVPGSPASPLTVSIDKNAGYGYLAEFEMIIDDESKADEAKSFLRALMKELDVDELPQDRLQRMFDYYNQNWRDYYGTEKTFSVE